MATTRLAPSAIAPTSPATVWPRFVTDAIDLARVVWSGAAKLPNGRRPAGVLFSVAGLAAMDLIASTRLARMR